MKKYIALLASIIVALPTFANWQLDHSNSIISFITIKKEHIAENHQFEKFSGSIDITGKVILDIDLSSVNTAIEIRDQRIKEHLFNTSIFPKATFTSQVNVTQLLALQVGMSEELSIKGDISLHGQVQSVTTKVLVTRLNEKKILVSSLQPLLIKAENFGLVKGINKLQALAHLPSISYVVPVSFNLQYTH